MNEELKIKDVVKHKHYAGLHCGSGIYPYAIVDNIEPLILVSEGRDMTWYHINKEDLIKIK